MSWGSNMKDKYFIGIYCPPYPPKDNYPNRIIKKSYDILKDVGINAIYGHYEDRYDYSYYLKAMEFCDEFGISYYPRLSIFDAFLKIPGAYKEYGGRYFSFLNKEEKEMISNTFIRQLKDAKSHPSFKGILIGDEAPIGSFKGINEARDIFINNFPDKEFHFNLFNYCMNDPILYGGKNADGYKDNKGDLAPDSEHRLTRFSWFIDQYFSITNCDVLSTDLYPYSNYWKEVPTTIHRGLYELPALLREYKNKYPHIKIYFYPQCGQYGYDVREVNEAEMALQINVPLAYGLDGLIFFPGVYPNDFLSDNKNFQGLQYGKAGFIDAKGDKTKYCDMVKPLLKQIQDCAPITLNSEFLGTYLVGDFHGGFQVDIKSLVDEDAIYQGQLPIHSRYEGEKLDINTNTQLLIGVFLYKENKKYYYIVNNSIVADSDFSINRKTYHLKPGHSILLSEEEL